MILISFVMTVILMTNRGKENQIQHIYNRDILKIKFSSCKIILIFKITEFPHSTSEQCNTYK